MSSGPITVKSADKLTKDELKAYADLMKVVWPYNPCATPREIAPEDPVTRPKRILALIKVEGVIVAGAEGFAKEILPLSGEPKTVLALASVCTHPDYRRNGFGERVVKAVLKRVDDREFPVALWQTGVPDFYKKFGAGTVSNRFVNSLHPTDKEKNPFWDKFIMIYPANANWPKGVIDLNGLGY